MADLNWPLPVEQMLECATEFLAADRRKFSDGPVVVRKMPQRDGSVKWAVYIPHLCLSKGGFWQYERMPSNREGGRKGVRRAGRRGHRISMPLPLTAHPRHAVRRVK